LQRPCVEVQMTIAHNRITAIGTSGVRLLTQLREYGHRMNRTEVAAPVEAFTEEARSTRCADPGPSGFDFSEDEAKRVLKSERDF
jgi:hypothetical protein